MSTEITHIKSLKQAPAKPKLSVLIPYYRDDPTALLDALLSQTKTRKDVEILIYDDGTGDVQLNAKVAAAVKSAHSAVHLMIAHTNKGRSAARNALQEQARADWVLFLDADMRPVSEAFLSDYTTLISAKIADVIFGGFTVPDKADTLDQELHRALSEVSDCLSLAARQAAGPQFVASSNLAVKKEVLNAEGFDDGFSGWGWEDSEWAARIAKKFTLLHADIPALHLGLETTETLLRRFKTSGHNYVRFTQKHPDIAKTLSLFRISQRLRKTPGQKLMRPALKLAVKLRVLPMKLRLLALKLWRASHYAEAFA
ncbi:glycosyltransferase family 2 protein [Hellea balneolensis]|uniref:glycosyltransferase family 2 protein n=1 Tax=Hellea balneolensis TaxID=287478 RepID=UPI000420873F|nr:glycosyltransferase family A protein [Hellea balneolensis]